MPWELFRRRCWRHGSPITYRLPDGSVATVRPLPVYTDAVIGRYETETEARRAMARHNGRWFRGNAEIREV